MSDRTSFARQSNGDATADPTNVNDFYYFGIGRITQAQVAREEQDEQDRRLAQQQALAATAIMTDGLNKASDNDGPGAGAMMIAALETFGYEVPAELRSFLGVSEDGPSGMASSTVDLGRHFGNGVQNSGIRIPVGRAGAYDGTFGSAISMFLQHEGGYVNHARDNGGETIMGITRRNFPGAFAQVSALARSGDMQGAREAAAGFYKETFWDPIVNYVDRRFGNLPLHDRQALYYAGFDMACHSGIGTAQRYLANSGGDYERMLGSRLNFLMNHEDADVFGRGWARRIGDVDATLDRFAARGPAPVFA